MNAATTSVLIIDVEDQLQSLWLDACRLQMVAEDENTSVRWEEAAHAWARLAKETPFEYRRDVALWWNLAADCAKKAKRR